MDEVDYGEAAAADHAAALERMQRQLVESVDMCLELEDWRAAKCEDVDSAIARELL